jgi:DUF971 family protein
MNPSTFQVIGTDLVVVWTDGHESYYELPTLRRDCPCAVCAGEPDLFGRIVRPKAQPLTGASFRLRSIDPAGNYGIQVNWEDGHTFGIWTWERLRAYCRCESCTSRKCNASHEPESSVGAD